MYFDVCTMQFVSKYEQRITNCANMSTAVFDKSKIYPSAKSEMSAKTNVTVPALLAMLNYLNTCLNNHVFGSSMFDVSRLTPVLCRLTVSEHH